MLTILGRADSSNVQMVMWGAAELGLNVERQDYGHRFGGLDTPEFRALNPHGRVPVLRDGSLVVWESCAILRYLAAQYGDGGAFWPADPAARARVDQWAEWGKLVAAVEFTTPIFWARVRTPARDRDEAALARDIVSYEARLDVLEAQIDAGGFVLGPDLTLADITIGHVLYRWFDTDIPRKPRPVIESYYGRLAARPGYDCHVMVSYDALRADGA